MRCTAVGRVLVVVVVLLLAAARGAVADTLRGKVVVSDVMIASAAQLESSQGLAAALRRVGRPEVVGVDGFWRFHFVAFLSAPAPVSGTFRVRASDVTDPRSPPREVRVFELTAPPGAPELRVNDFVVTAAMGFERGHSYELAVSPAPDDGAATDQKPDVSARGVVTLR
jgi:hypothetical protein